MLVCLEEWQSFYQVATWLVIPRNQMLRCNSPSTNTCLSWYLKLDRHILKEPPVSSRYTLKAGSCDALCLNRLWIYFECTNKESVSYSDPNASVLNSGTVPIIPLRLCLVSKLVTSGFHYWNGHGFLFYFSVFKNGSWCTRTWFRSFYLWFLLFSIFLTGGGDWECFSHSSGGTKIIRCNVIFNYYY